MIKVECYDAWIVLCEKACVLTLISEEIRLIVLPIVELCLVEGICKKVCKVVEDMLNNKVLL